MAVTAGMSSAVRRRTGSITLFSARELRDGVRGAPAEASQARENSSRLSTTRGLAAGGRGGPGPPLVARGRARGRGGLDRGGGQSLLVPPAHADADRQVPGV